MAEFSDEAVEHEHSWHRGYGERPYCDCGAEDLSDLTRDDLIALLLECDGVTEEFSHPFGQKVMWAIRDDARVLVITKDDDG